MRRARTSIQEQLQSITKRLATLPAGSAEQQSLIAARGQLVLDLSQATVFEEGAAGSLTLLKEANSPSQPTSPRPLRNAVLAFTLALLLTSGVIILRELLQRKVRSVTDLIAFGVPAIGELPRLNRAKRSNTVQQARSGDLYESVGFVRVNLSHLLPPSGAMLTVSSARPSEGKSTLVAAFASSYSAANKRVLVIDADLHRPSQQEFWAIGGRPWVALTGAAQSQQTNLAQAIEHPETASAVDMGENIHVLPAGNNGRQATSLLNEPRLPALLRQWASAYDIVLIDTPPILALSDAYTIAKQSDGLLLVVESGETSVPDVQRAMLNMQHTGTKFLGVVVNKIQRGQQGYYYKYNYSSSPA